MQSTFQIDRPTPPLFRQPMLRAAAPRSRVRLELIDLLFGSVLVCAIYQLWFIRVSELDFAIYSVLCYGLLALLIGQSMIRLDVIAKLFLLFTGVQLASVTWSPEPMTGLSEIFHCVQFLPPYLYVTYCARRPALEAVVVQLLKAYCIAALLHSAIVVVGQADPDLKMKFLGSNYATYFIFPKNLDEFQRSADNNVADPRKSGGFFLNANTGAVASEIAAYLSVALIAYGRKKPWIAIAAVHFLAVVCSGSKSALGLLLFAPFAAWYLVQLIRSHRSGGRQLMLLLLLIVAGAAYYFVYDNVIDTDLGRDAVLNAERRRILQDVAWEEFKTSPILGQGFGGWALSFSRISLKYAYIGLNAKMAAHNSLIIIWSQSGIIAAGLGLLIVVIMGWKLLQAARAPNFTLQAGAGFAALLSMFIHGLGDNFGIFGEPHIQAPIAAFVGWVIVAGRRRLIEQEARAND